MENKPQQQGSKPNNSNADMKANYGFYANDRSFIPLHVHTRTCS